MGERLLGCGGAGGRDETEVEQGIMLVDLVARLRALPRKKNEVWQGGPVRLPLWTSPEPGGTPIRPWSVWWANAVRTELADDRVESAKRDDITLEAALEAMVKFAESFRPQGCRPESIKTNDAAFAAAAKPVLAAADVDVQLVERLPFLDDAIKKATLTEQNDDRAGVMSAKGMTLERVRGLADAAALFFAAAPWRRFDPFDLVSVIAPNDAGTRLFHVLTLSEGRFLLRSVASKAAFAPPDDDERFEPGDQWRLASVSAWDVPIADSELWERERLPLMGDGFRPDLLQERADGRVRGASARDVVFFEGLLRTLADIRVEELDQGRFERTVPTADGPRKFVCELPDVLNAPAPDRNLPPVEDALQAFGRTRRARLEGIVARDPNHVDALRELALGTPDDKVAADLLRRAVHSLEKAMGNPRLKALEKLGNAREDDDGDRLVTLYDDLGQSLDRDDPIGAEAAFRRALVLDPADLSLVRHRLVGLLLAGGKHAEAAPILAECRADDAFTLYARALEAFRAHGGDASQAQEAAAAAYAANRDAVNALDGPPGDPIPEFEPDSLEEADWIGARLGPAWSTEKDAMSWLLQIADAVDEADARTDPEGDR